jgi:UDP-2,3-diacylglucosamine hydrolase
VSHSLFVSDLHLADERPHISAVFFEFVSTIATQAEALYILGDLFEYWIGDDGLDEPLNAAVADALSTLGARGIGVHFLHGNRDFLIGQTFAARARATLISDPTMVDLYGTRTLLMHGDTLCTDDVDYQKFRATARDPRFQKDFLAQPIEARRKRVGQLREINAQAKQAKSAEIMDVTPATVEDALRRFGYPRLIHGHTHRPARHVHHIDGHACERWVLNDWYERGGYLRCDADGCAAVML